MHFKFKLQLKFGNNENYSSIIVNFHTGYHKKFVNLQLKFRKSKSYHERKTAHWYIVTSLLLKPLQQHLIDVTLFRLLKSICSQSVLFEHAKNFSSVFPKPMDHSIYKTKFQNMSAFLFPFSISCITLTLPLMLKTFLAFMTIAMLSHYQSPVKCSSRTPKTNFIHQGITVINVIVKAWNIYGYLRRDKEMAAL